jgi:hypothetical protein
MFHCAQKCPSKKVLHGGGIYLRRISNKLPLSINVQTILMSKSKDFQAALLGSGNNVNSNNTTTVSIFIVQTIENESPHRGCRCLYTILST